MTLHTAWRISPPHYADSAFSGRGAEHIGGRFNSPGLRMVYTADSLALALLEMLVQAGTRRRLAGYRCRSVTFSDDQVRVIDVPDLPEGWDARPYTTISQAVGDRWLRETRSLVLRVPSVVVPQEHNYLINPLHPAFSGLSFGEVLPVPLDPRLVPSSGGS